MEWRIEGGRLKVEGGRVKGEVWGEAVAFAVNYLASNL
jgi:hypothetical protein